MEQTEQDLVSKGVTIRKAATPKQYKFYCHLSGASSVKTSWDIFSKLGVREASGIIEKLLEKKTITTQVVVSSSPITSDEHDTLVVEDEKLQPGTFAHDEHVEELGIDLEEEEESSFPSQPINKVRLGLCMKLVVQAWCQDSTIQTLTLEKLNHTTHRLYDMMEVVETDFNEYLDASDD